MQGLIPGYRRDLEIRRYPLLVYLLVPLVALVLQAWLPRVLGRFAYMDLPLLVTIYFALNRRSPIHGTLLGAVLGMAQDGLTQGAIGIHGIANTVVGFLAASIGIRIVVENNFIRMVLNFAFTLLSSALVLFVVHILLGLDWQSNWLEEVLRAAGNGVIGLVLFPLLDRTQMRD
ncbi:rod shape-determining protein MreD [Acidicapsa acidisoli]|uniref:rod shape-determining protein MreD n=1 Tax=Acidicapsa acidisoli TaxID=1615681 RepID=UPI0021E024C9|nr:rod shape-determining protein MreD [Acidicapsa acidisoli]